MKRFALAFAAVITIWSFQSCKEIGPSIDFTPVNTDTSFPGRAFDTTYTITPPAPDLKRVLVEEYTGVQCTNCPAGAQVLKTYEDAHPGRIEIVGLHSGSLSQPVPGESKYDFRNSDLVTLFNSYFGENPPKPAASFDRTKGPDGFFNVNRAAWPSVLDQRTALTPPVNVSVTSAYDTMHGKSLITVKVVYTTNVSVPQHLSVWLVEDSLVDVQLYPDHHDENYLHNHVFRDFITPIIGSSILENMTTKTAGRVYERSFIYTPKKPEWNLNHCRIIAFVHNDQADNKEVQQVAETPFK